MGNLLHSQAGFKPRVFPYLLNPGAAEIDRAQSLDPTVTLTKDAINELGRDGIAGWLKDVPVVGCTLSQMEYGSIEIFRKFANKTDATTSLTLSDFDTSAFDIVAYLTDNSSTFIGSLWYPMQRLTGFTITIGDPTALIERRFEMTGEQAHLFQGDNAYFVEITDTVASGDLSGSDFDVVLNDPDPVEDPDNSGVYFFRIVRVRGTTTSTLATTDYSYVHETTTLTISDAAVADVYKIYYSATTYISGESVFTENDTDLFGMRAHSAVLYIGVSNRLYKIQSATVDVRFDRDDVREIGNEDVVARGVRNKTVTVTLGGLLDSELTLEEVLRGESSGYGKIDMDELSNDLTFVAAFYSDSAHGTFKWGFSCGSMAPTEIKPGTGNVDAHVDRTVTLEGEAMTISSTEAGIGL